MRINYILLSIFFLTLFTSSQAQRKTSFGIGAGGAKMIGLEGQNYGMGINIHVESFHSLTEVTAVGGRFGYNMMFANGQNLNGGYIHVPSGVSVKETQLGVFELTPSVRFTTRGRGSKLFFQMGAGYYNVRAEEEIYGTAKTYVNSGFGFNSAAGLMIGKSTFKLALYPMYNYVASDRESYNFLSFNLGFIFF